MAAHHFKDRFTRLLGSSHRGNGRQNLGRETTTSVVRRDGAAERNGCRGVRVEMGKPVAATVRTWVSPDVRAR